MPPTTTHRQPGKMGRKNYTTTPPRPLKQLQPHPPRPLQSHPAAAPFQAPPPTTRCFYDLPAELRVEIYRLALRNVKIHIIPTTHQSTDSNSSSSNNAPEPCPHALVRTTRQIRLEVLPLMHTICPITTTVTDFDFGGLLTWLSRIPAEDLSGLVRNQDLEIKLCTTKRGRGNLPTLRRWLKARGDPCIPQPNWKYTGPMPQDKIASDLRRRVKRMPEKEKAAEFRKMLSAIHVHVPPEEEGGKDDTPL